MRRKVKALAWGAVVCVLLINALPAFAQISSGICDTTAIAGDNSVALVDVQYDFPEAGQSTWFYRVDCNSTDKFIRRFQFKLGTDCHLIGNVEKNMGTWDLATGQMTPGDGKPKIKFHNTRGYQKAMFNQKFTDNGSRGYYITYDYNYTMGEVTTIVFKGTKDPILGWAEGDKLVRGICGPDTSCTIICTDQCAPPRRLSAYMDSDTSVYITWDKIDCHKSYRLCGFSEDGSVAGCQQASGSSRHFKLLRPGVRYYVYMRSNCKGIGTSGWSDTISFVAGAGNVSERVAEFSGVDVLAEETSMESIFASSEGFALYPNPVVNQVNVQPGAGDWKIVSYHGVVYRRGTASADERLGLDVADLPNGMYFFEVENDQGRNVQPFLISH